MLSKDFVQVHTDSIVVDDVRVTRQSVARMLNVDAHILQPIVRILVPYLAHIVRVFAGCVFTHV